MDRDPVRFWRSAFVVTGGLIAVWSALAALYVGFLRVPARTSTGDDARLACSFGEVMVDGACTDLSWLGILLFLMGMGILVAGLALFKPRTHRAEDMLLTGPGTRFSLALMTTLVAVPLAFAFMAAGRTGTAQEEWVRFGPSAYGAAPLLWGAAGLALIALAAALSIHVAHESRKRHYLHVLRMHAAREAQAEADAWTHGVVARAEPRQPPPQPVRHPAVPSRPAGRQARQAPASAQPGQGPGNLPQGAPRDEKREGRLPATGFRW